MKKIRTGTRYRRLIEPFEEMYLAKLSIRDISNLLRVGKGKVGNSIKRLQISREQREAVNIAKYKYSKPNTKHWRTCRANARKVYEKFHNVKLKSSQHIHHIDEDYTNNKIENLELKDGSEHVREHQRIWRERRRENTVSNPM